MKTPCYLCIGLLLASCGNSAGVRGKTGPEAEADAVKRVVAQVLDAVTDRDAETWRRLLHKDGIWYVQKIESDGAVNLSTSTTRQRIEQLANMEPGIVDRVFEPEVRVAGPIATFWARYEARNFSGDVIACGVDAFQLVKTGPHWRITNIMYTEYVVCP